jgi:pimeloyl-ACP methyl ester carboxylesterase
VSRPEAPAGATAFGGRPSRLVTSPDGTPIATFALSADREPRPGAPTLLLVHGTSADHRTWRVSGPLLARRRTVVAMDRRGRGDSGDAGDWSIEREVEDVAAVAEALAADAGRPVDVLGHSLGGRTALAATLRTAAIRRVAAYEGAPGTDRVDPGLLARLRALLDAGDLDGLLAEFMTDAVGMPAEDLAAFRVDPIWPLRAAAGPTIVRELEAAENDPAIGREALARVTVPVLQLVGSASPAWFRDGAAALDSRLVDGRLEVVEGARHAAHHSHPIEFVARVEAFLDA